jgi:hypothetical protein
MVLRDSGVCGYPIESLFSPFTDCSHAIIGIRESRHEAPAPHSRQRTTSTASWTPTPTAHSATTEPFAMSACSPNSARSTRSSATARFPYLLLRFRQAKGFGQGWPHGTTPPDAGFVRAAGPPSLAHRSSGGRPYENRVHKWSKGGLMDYTAPLSIDLVVLR